MKTTEPSLTYFGPFYDLFRIQVHQLIAWGFQDARRRIRSNDEQEPAITGYIAKAIKDRCRALDCPRWCNYYFVRDDPPEEKEGESGRSRPRADIVIEASFPGRPEFIFEAKRLRKRGYGVSKYVASEGIGCFTSGLYASRYDEAAMLGYIQSDSLTYWRDEIRKRIDRDRNKLHLKSFQHDARIIDALPLEWISEHERDSVGRSITIYHILLDCCS
jgi:hypothetical protein